MQRMTLAAWLGLALAAPIAFVVWYGGRAAWAEHRAATPQRGPVPRPPGNALPPGTLDVSFETKLGATVRGWWCPGSGQAAVLLVHGSGGDRRTLLPELTFLARHGYSVLAYDHPGHGESSGAPSFTADIPAGVTAALDWLSTQPNVDPHRLGALGFSMGAAMVAKVAKADPRIAAAVLEGCFTDADEHTRYEYRRWGPITVLPALWTIRAHGIGPGMLQPESEVGAISPRPLLIVAGAEDTAVPPWMAERLYAAARAPKALYVVPGAGHGDYARVAAADYEARITSFFDGALGVTTP